MEETMIRFREFLKEGTFVGLRLCEASKNEILKFQIDNNIKNPTPISDLHVTVIYSKKKMHNIEVDGILENPYIAHITKFDIFNGVLVGLLECPALENRHVELLHRYIGDHQYDSYQPHVSFSYKFVGKLSDIKPFTETLKLVNEYEEVSK